MSGITNTKVWSRLSVAVLCVAASCGSHDATSPVTLPPGAVSLSPGNVASFANAQQLQVQGGATGGEFLLVVTDTVASGNGAATFGVTATAIGAPGVVSLPSSDRVGNFELGRGPRAGAGATLDMAYGARLNEVHRSRYLATLPAARAQAATTPGAHRSLQAAAIAVGDVLSFNVGSDACDTVVMHAARVVAVSSKAIIVADTLNPANGGFSPANYQRFAAQFDTLVYPLDVANFGAPADIDGNGRIVLLFTRAVNELTPRNAQSFVGGFFFGRDLLPRTAANAADACAGSNLGELFYLLAPDPAGLVNGNARTTGFVDSITVGIIAHEFQHLINASRRIYINHASDFEVVWLNEGLSHVAEELLFYHQAQLAPRLNIDASRIRASAAALNAFNEDQIANTARYREYLVAPSENSPVRDDDSLATRGATWNFLRYAADRRLGGAGTESAVWQALVNSTTTGVTNLRSVFGADIGGLLRDWSISHYTDDLVLAVPANLLQPSWNWRSLFSALSGSSTGYPLLVKSLTTAGATGTVIPGGAAYFRFSIPAGALATLVVSGGTSRTGLPTGTVVRMR